LILDPSHHHPVPFTPASSLLLSPGAIQEHWLTGGVSPESILSDSGARKDENHRCLQGRALVLEEYLHLLGLDAERSHSKDVRRWRVTIELSYAYRGVGQTERARAMLESLLFELKTRREETQDTGR
jgi:hypothetical protein